MYKTISWFAYLWWYLLKPKFRLMLLSYRGKIVERDFLAHEIARKWAISALAMNGSKIEVQGKENVPQTGGVLFVANHQSNFDIPIFIGHIPRNKGFIAKLELSKIPFFSRYMRYLGCIFIERKDSRQTLTAMNNAAEMLKAGHSLVIFPEGTRSTDGTIGLFKPGSLKIAYKAGVPIVPITISGSKDIMPKGTSRIGSAKVQVVIAPPIFFDNFKEMESNQIAQWVRNIIVENQHKIS